MRLTAYHIFYRSFTNPKYWVQRVKSSECPKITADFLEEQHDQIGDLRYRIEYEAEFIEDQNALFTQDIIRGCIETYKERELITDKQILDATTLFRGEYFLGCDLGKRFDHSVIFLLKKTKVTILSEETARPITLDPVWRVVYTKQFDLRTKYKIVTGWIKMLYGKFPITHGCVDQTGVGEGVMEDLADEVEAGSIEGIWLSAPKKQEVIMFLYTKMEQKRIPIPFQRELISQLNEQQYYYGSSKQKVVAEEKGVMLFGHPEGRHDDQLWALAMAAFATRGQAGSGGVVM